MLNKSYLNYVPPQHITVNYKVMVKVYHGHFSMTGFHPVLEDACNLFRNTNNNAQEDKNAITKFQKLDGLFINF